MNEDDFTALLHSTESLTTAQDDLTARVEALEDAALSSGADPSTLAEWME